MHTGYEIKDGIVQIPQHDYEALLERLEDAQDAAAAKHALANIEEFFPGEVMKALIDGENPVRVFRKHRNMTQARLADIVGMKQPQIADIESGKSRGSVDSLKDIAEALDVDMGMIV